MGGKNQLERILEIDRWLRQKRYPAKQEFEEIFEVTAKTIERDFEFMRDRLEAPLVYNARHRGYAYDEEGYFLPSVYFKSGEFLALLLTEKTARIFRDTPLFGDLREGLEKISAFMPPNISLNLNWLTSRLSVTEGAPAVINPKIWDAVLQGLQGSRCLEICYRSPGRGGERERLFDPYHLAACNGGWYLIGLDHASDELRVFSMARIIRCKITVQEFSLPKDFRAEDYVDPWLGIDSRQTSFTVKLRFSAAGAPYARERGWHRDQSLSEGEDGSVVLSFPTTHLGAVQREVLSWGPLVQVLAPPELKSRVKQSIREMLSLY